MDRPAPAPTLESAEAEALQRAEEILRQIKLAIHPGTRRATIELAPPELGRIAIHLALRRGRMAAILRAESPETLALLHERTPELAALLERQGIEADGFELHLGFGERSRGHDLGRPSTQAKAAQSPTPQSLAITPANADASRASARAASGALDTYA